MDGLLEQFCNGKQAGTQHLAMAIAAVAIVPSLHLLLKFFKSGMSYDSEVQRF